MLREVAGATRLARVYERSDRRRVDECHRATDFGRDHAVLRVNMDGTARLTLGGASHRHGTRTRNLKFKSPADFYLNFQETNRPPP